ncbi:MAG: hypothetical protein KKC29_02930 [Alphaproteobacteria bacterium]|nr:hypothetical protein [Alphaproteobacteria bacterium]MBU2041972.1 hypothetical protein [Alphaproteobacteria bacterium]MBU2125126.1 hypothetical protein [Alphaproteobacteria bacterium]MBU2207537.1 hypothetical protein [Alphaproteobacteria bacterium]MBU2290038.1 hypothetical protein [Alphaproteobacteria bacterium]
MLSLLLMLVSDPLAAPPPPPPALMPRLLELGPQTPRDCRAGGFQMIQRPPASGESALNNLMFTPDHEVRRYLLIERSVRGCPAPISYAVPYRSVVSPPDPANSPPSEPFGSD